MITSVNKNNEERYKALFKEAADVLMGYKKVYTYDAKVNTYYYKNSDSKDPETMYLDAEVTSATDFIKKLREYTYLYTRILKDDNVTPIEPAPGFDPNIPITTIEEYFSWIRNLGQIDRKYTILPLDEEAFEINANTRGITVPPNFKRNGVAVQGDDIAEVLYFKIDRYFDYCDFNNMEIFIQWETPKDKDGVQKIGVSQEYVRDIESEPGKLIFGWPITKEITHTPGVLKFSVRFFDWADEKAQEKTLKYSFSTLTASINIQPALNYNLAEEGLFVDDAGDRIVERLENSQVIGGYLASKPVFIVNLKPEEDLDEVTGTKELIVHAVASGDAGDISYRWSKEIIPENPGDPITIENDIPSENGYDLVEDNSTLKKGQTYYYIHPSKPGEYFLYGGPIPIPEDNDLPDYQKVLYEKVSKCVVDSVGKYWVWAVNRVGSTFAEDDSNVCIIPRPLPVENVIAPDAELDNADGKVILAINEETGLPAPTVLKTGASNEDGELTYEWYYDSNKLLHLGDEGEGGFTWVKETDEEDNPITTQSLPTVKEGHYKAKVFNNRNKEQTSAESAIVRVTKPAEEPTISPIDKAAGDDRFNDKTLSDENCPTVTLKDDVVIFSDAYSVQWFKLNDATGTYYAVSEDERDKFKFNPLNIPEDVFTENNDPEPLTGAYMARVTNHVNGSSAFSETDQYIIY